MFRSILLRRASAGAFALAFASSSSSALAQEALPSIEIGARQDGAAGAETVRPSGQGGEKTSNGFGSRADKETGYARSTSFAATKTNTPLIDTPVAVEIVPREVIEDKQILNVMEATRNVSGVQAQPGTYLRPISNPGLSKHGADLSKRVEGLCPFQHRGHSFH